MSNLLEDLPSLMILIGAALLLVEALAFGFSLVILAALGFATITTGLLIKFGLVRESVDAALTSTIIVTVGSVLLAWKPLKKIGRTSTNTAVKSDLVGYRFRLETKLEMGETAYHRYSGIDWQLEGDTPMAVGTLVEVTDVEVGKLIISIAE